MKVSPRNARCSEPKAQNLARLIAVFPLALVVGNACQRDQLFAVIEDPNPIPGQGGASSSALPSGSPNGGTSVGGASAVPATGGRPDAPCRKGGELCQPSDTCCSGACGGDGRCLILDRCRVSGENCTSNDECCSRACSDPGTGTKVCHAIEGCRPELELCTVGGDYSECCSRVCIKDIVTGVSRCGQDLTKGCLPEGEICGDPLRPPCCGPNPTGNTGALTCLMSIIGVPRCINPLRPNDCQMPDSPCNVGNGCCPSETTTRHYCLPKGDGLKCSLNCAAQNGACRASRDCCPNMFCNSGTCQASDPSCNQLGHPCSSSADCCNKNCVSREANPPTCGL